MGNKYHEIAHVKVNWNTSFGVIGKEHEVTEQNFVGKTAEYKEADEHRPYSITDRHHFGDSPPRFYRYTHTYTNTFKQF